MDQCEPILRARELPPDLLEWGSVKTHEARTVHLPRFLRDELPDLAERLDALRARTAPLARPSGAP